MDKEPYIPLLVIALTIGFAIVSLAVWMSRGNPWWINKKLRLGAILLTLTATAQSAGAQDYTSCYLAPDLKPLSRHKVGIVAGASYGQIKDSYNAPLLKDKKMIFPNGFAVGAEYVYFFNSWIENLSFVFGVEYTSLSKSTTLDAESDFVNISNQIVEVKSYAEYDYSVEMLALTARFSIAPSAWEGFNLDLGAYLGLPLTSDAETAFYKELPYDDGHGNILYMTKQDSVAKGDFAEDYDYDVGIRAVVGYRFDLGREYDKLSIIPMLRASFSLVPAFSDIDYAAPYVDFGVMIRYEI